MNAQKRALELSRFWLIMACVFNIIACAALLIGKLL